MIQIRPFPTDDREFERRVRNALGNADDAPIFAPSESRLRSALPFVRYRYPEVWIRRQETVAAPPGSMTGETWYIFRDEWIGGRDGDKPARKPKKKRG
jgi:hypothetical protein